MNKIDQLNNIELIDEKSLTNIEGSKGGKVNIGISVSVSWDQIRDTLRGIGDGIFGHRRKY
ncbi:TPA: hypothetical protein U1265_000117 [Streptococcus suis]|uniref:hypothetical protein n=1 Tax=Streptococcus suis TaxID=1307 RepID=UPI00155389A2|nr:hypothetical protein [Streptococcus suis]MCQ8261995.1 hypothetical protein [Streptococcus suis]MDG4507602.1 hypothetical protein [Streptococcus suis]NQI35810.1 hypothetical protein [Streptococcus suis]NQI37681.1 hypothetical protein [Streptococcus suis]NQI47350.1 hypothetical protein [Streptococcus suis]